MTIDELKAIESALKGRYTCHACRTVDPAMEKIGPVPVHVDCPSPDDRGLAQCFELYEFPTRDQALAIVQELLRYRGASGEVFDPEIVRVGERIFG